MQSNARRFATVASSCSLLCCVVSLALLAGGVFLSFWIGWRVQLSEFRAQNSTLTSYDALFQVPAVAPPWPVFSCFLYGALILVACTLGLSLVLVCCCSVAGGCALCHWGSTPEEWTPLQPTRYYESKVSFS
jgi:hypothetical protein